MSSQLQSTLNQIQITPLLVSATGEFRLCIAFAVTTLMTAILIRVIQAVVISITDVDARNAVAIVAGKEVAKARFGAGFAVIWRFIRT